MTDDLDLSGWLAGMRAEIALNTNGHVQTLRNNQPKENKMSGTLTVKELIVELLDCDMDASVYIKTGDIDCVGISHADISGRHCKRKSGVFLITDEPIFKEQINNEQCQLNN